MLSSTRYEYIILKKTNLKLYKIKHYIKLIENRKSYCYQSCNLTFVASREYIDERHGNMTRGKLTAIDITKPILIMSLDRHCEKLVRMFPENIITFK